MDKMKTKIKTIRKKLNYRQNFIDETLSIDKISLSTNIIRR